MLLLPSFSQSLLICVVTHDEPQDDQTHVSPIDSNKQCSCSAHHLSNRWWTWTSGSSHTSHSCAGRRIAAANDVREEEGGRVQGAVRGGGGCARESGPSASAAAVGGAAGHGAGAAGHGTPPARSREPPDPNDGVPRHGGAGRDGSRADAGEAMTTRRSARGGDGPEGPPGVGSPVEECPSHPDCTPCACNRVRRSRRARYARQRPPALVARPLPRTHSCARRWPLYYKAVHSRSIQNCR
ncbi:hypothetical protein BS78_06G254600 [Paspalum vaginatum]|nr:hypothetical protein BS78_06G254600 [Paspalum vaginatum]